MLRCSIWFSAPSFWMGGGLAIRCVGGRVYLKHVELRIINKITLLHQVGIPNYFINNVYSGPLCLQKYLFPFRGFSNRDS